MTKPNGALTAWIWKVQEVEIIKGIPDKPTNLLALGHLFF